MRRILVWGLGGFAILLVFLAASMTMRTLAWKKTQSHITQAVAGQVMHAADQKNPAIRVVALTRYGSCDACAQAHQALALALDDAAAGAADIQVVVQPIPLSDPHNQRLARLALAAGLQDKFAPFHDALMNYDGALTDDVVRTLAVNAGVDFDRLNADMNDPRVNDALSAGRALMDAVKPPALPSFVFNDRLVFAPPKDGVFQSDDFIAFFDHVRKTSQP
ncbi:DsbA family protein [Micavibrio aeruginosavorus]|uniref:DsbA family protein n=1 Tax=Micavibrio aeruginosavorus TaxID=349221 RepID=UPI001F2A8DA1|nr:DsbA family protein [Micavibrio aeruginosavorus]